MYHLATLASVLLSLQSPDPLLATVLDEIDRRPPTELLQLRAQALYPLHIVRILSENEAALTSGRLSKLVADTLQQLVVSKCSSINRVSKLESQFKQALTDACVAFECNTKIQYNISADFMCEVGGETFCLEVNGPSHYLVSPMQRPRGKSTLKVRTFRAIGVKLVVVPYWIVSPPQSYVPENKSGRIPQYAINHDTLMQLIATQLASDRPCL